jgi:drug/metabolite transporter (DMT)-like permease
VFAALLTPLLFSLSVLCGHRSARMIGGTEANFWRVTCAAVFLGVWAVWRGAGLEGAGFALFVASGVFGIGVGDVAFFQALPRLGSRLSLLLIECLSAPLGALIEWLWLGTTLNARQIACGVVTLAGVGIALSPREHAGRSRRDIFAGTIFSTVGALGTAVGAVLSRKGFEAVAFSGERIDTGTAAYDRVLGGVVVAGICLLVAKRHILRVQSQAPRELVVRAAVRKWKGVWIWVVLNGLFGQTLGVTCMQAALRTLPTGIVLAIIAVTPIVVIPLAYLFENERPTALSITGGAVACAGVAGLVLLSNPR